MPFTIQDAVAVTVSNEAFHAADENTISALKEMMGLSSTGRCKWVKPFTLAVDTSGLSPSSHEGIMGVVAQLSRKDILAVFRMGHDVIYSQAPSHQFKGRLDFTFTDKTAHTVTTVVATHNSVVITITFAAPVNISRAASASEFR